MLRNAQGHVRVRGGQLASTEFPASGITGIAWHKHQSPSACTHSTAHVHVHRGPRDRSGTWRLQGTATFPRLSASGRRAIQLPASDSRRRRRNQESLYGVHWASNRTPSLIINLHASTVGVGPVQWSVAVYEIKALISWVHKYYKLPRGRVQVITWRCWTLRSSSLGKARNFTEFVVGL